MLVFWGVAICLLGHFPRCLTISFEGIHFLISLLRTRPFLTEKNFTMGIMKLLENLGLSPLPVTVANEGLQGSPTKHVLILGVTVAGKGDHPKKTTKKTQGHFSPPNENPNSRNVQYICHMHSVHRFFGSIGHNLVPISVGFSWRNSETNSIFAGRCLVMSKRAVWMAIFLLNDEQMSN